jgi:hypothetical protein
MSDSVFFSHWLFFYGTLIVLLAMGLLSFLLPIGRRSRRTGRRLPGGDR